MFNRVKPVGWGTNEILTSTQMNTLDTDHSKALDPYGGGTYNTLSAPLEVSGSDIHLMRGFTTLTVGDGLSTLVCNAATDFQQGVNCSSGSSTFTGDVTCNGTLSASGNVNLGNAAGDAISVAGTMTILATLVNSGAGRMVFRAPGVITDGTGNFVITTANFYTLAAATLSNDRTWTISDMGAVDGDWFFVFSADAGWTLTVNSPAAVNLGNLKSGTSSYWTLVMRVGGTWVQIGRN